jgi:anti-sigma factor RsiW
MHEPLCRWLDDFLAHDLAGDERQRFVNHLTDCPRCRDAVTEYRRMSGRLVEAVERLEPAPLTLAGSVERQIHVVRRRRFAVAAVALAASIALIAIWLQADRTVQTPSSKNAVPMLASTAPRVRVSFPDRNVIAVPVESESPNVTVLMVYPTIPSEIPERNER